MGFAPAWPRRVDVSRCLVAAPRAARSSVLKANAKATATIRKLTFEPRMRLHTPAEFRDVKRRGRKFVDNLFALAVLANRESHPRLGLAIATRTFGTAVARNRIK